MGKLTCSRCGGEIEKPTLKEAVDHLDHGIGKNNGRPCPNNPKEYPVFWNGQIVHFDDKGNPIETVFVRSPKIIQGVSEVKTETKKTDKPKKK